MEHKYLKDIIQDNYIIHEWPFINANEELRVYYKPELKEKSGFQFYAISRIGWNCVPETEVNRWHPDHCMVEVLYHGYGYFDGVRHLYMGHKFTDNYGYDFYPDLDNHIDAMLALKSLEQIYCRKD